MARIQLQAVMAVFPAPCACPSAAQRAGFPAPEPTSALERERKALALPLRQAKEVPFAPLGPATRAMTGVTGSLCTVNNPLGVEGEG